MSLSADDVLSAFSDAMNLVAPANDGETWRALVVDVTKKPDAIWGQSRIVGFDVVEASVKIRYILTRPARQLTRADRIAKAERMWWPE